MKDSLKSRDQKVYEGCKKKNFYDDYWSAAHFAAVARERSTHDNIYTYKCRFCAGWHIGHRRVKGVKIIQRKLAS